MNTTLLSDKLTPASAEAEHHDELAQIAERVLEIPQPDTPRLDIHRVGCQVSITWQGTDEKFRLEISDHAYVHGDWRPVEVPVQFAGGVYRVLLPGAAHVRYLRLARGRSRKAVPAIPKVRPNQPATRSDRVRPPALPAGKPGRTMDWLGLLAIVATGKVVLAQLLRLL